MVQNPVGAEDMVQNHAALVRVSMWDSDSRQDVPFLVRIIIMHVVH